MFNFRHAVLLAILAAIPFSANAFSMGDAMGSIANGVFSIADSIAAILLAIVALIILGVWNALVLFQACMGSVMVAIAVVVAPIGILVSPFISSWLQAAVGFAMTGVFINVVSYYLLSAMLHGLNAMLVVLQSKATLLGSFNSDEVKSSFGSLFGVCLILIFMILVQLQVPGWVSTLFGGAAFNTPRMRGGGGGGKKAGGESGSVAGPSAGSGGGTGVAAAARGSVGSVMPSGGGMARASGGGGGGGGGGRSLPNYSGSGAKDMGFAERA